MFFLKKTKKTRTTRKNIAQRHWKAQNDAMAEAEENSDFSTNLMRFKILESKKKDANDTKIERSKLDKTKTDEHRFEKNRRKLEKNIEYDDTTLEASRKYFTNYEKTMERDESVTGIDRINIEDRKYQDILDEDVILKPSASDTPSKDDSKEPNRSRKIEKNVELKTISVVDDVFESNKKELQPSDDITKTSEPVFENTKILKFERSDGTHVAGKIESDRDPRSENQGKRFVEGEKKEIDNDDKKTLFDTRAIENDEVIEEPSRWRRDRENDCDDLLKKDDRFDEKSDTPDPRASASKGPDTIEESSIGKEKATYDSSEAITNRTHAFCKKKRAFKMHKNGDLSCTLKRDVALKLVPLIIAFFFCVLAITYTTSTDAVKSKTCSDTRKTAFNDKTGDIVYFLKTINQKKPNVDDLPTKNTKKVTSLCNDNNNYNGTLGCGFEYIDELLYMQYDHDAGRLQVYDLSYLRSPYDTSDVEELMDRPDTHMVFNNLHLCNPRVFKNNENTMEKCVKENYGNVVRTHCEDRKSRESESRILHCLKYFLDPILANVLKKHARRQSTS